MLLFICEGALWVICCCCVWCWYYMLYMYSYIGMFFVTFGFVLRVFDFMLYYQNFGCDYGVVSVVVTRMYCMLLPLYGCDVFCVRVLFVFACSIYTYWLLCGWNVFEIYSVVLCYVLCVWCVHVVCLCLMWLVMFLLLCICVCAFECCVCFMCICVCIEHDCCLCWLLLLICGR